MQVISSPNVEQENNWNSKSSFLSAFVLAIFLSHTLTLSRSLSLSLTLSLSHSLTHTRTYPYAHNQAHAHSLSVILIFPLVGFSQTLSRSQPEIWFSHFLSHLNISLARLFNLHLLRSGLDLHTKILSLVLNHYSTWIEHTSTFSPCSVGQGGRNRQMPCCFFIKRGGFPSKKLVRIHTA